MLPNSIKTLQDEIRSISVAVPRAVHAHIKARNPVIDSSTPPIIAFPGIGSPAFILRPLIEYLKQEGHNAHTWGDRINLGPTYNIYRHAEALIQRSGTPIIGIGHSLGALYHLHFAHLYPESYSHVIGLAGPCNLTLEEAHTHTNIGVAFTLINYLKPFYRQDLMQSWQREVDRLPLPDSVQCSMIIAAKDGIVSPLSCELPPHPNYRNYYVNATHGGLLDDPITHELTEHLTKHGNQVPIPEHIQRHLLTRDQVEIFQKAPPITPITAAQGIFNFCRAALHR